MATKKVASKPVPSPVKLVKSGPGLKVHPDQATEAVDLLERFIAERAELAKDKGRIGSTVSAIKLFDALFRFKTIISDRIKTPLEAAYDCMRFTTIPEFMDEEGVTNITVDGVGRCNLTDDVQVSMGDNKDKFLGWLVENEFEDMISQTVNAQTLAAWVRKRLREGADIPNDLLTVKPVVRAAITRS